MFHYSRHDWRRYHGTYLIPLCFLEKRRTDPAQWFFFPDTNGKPLEECAAIFGDADEVAIYQRDIDIDIATHTIRGHRLPTGDSKGVEARHVEQDKEATSTESNDKVPV